MTTICPLDVSSRGQTGVINQKGQTPMTNPKNADLLRELRASLDGVDLETDATQTVIQSLAAISTWINQVDATPSELARMLPDIKTHSDHIAAAVGFIHDEIAAYLIDNGGVANVAIGDKNYVFTAEKRVSRKAIDRDGLIRAVEKASSDPKHRVVPETGEIMSSDDVKSALLKKAFRMEPRWSELKKLDINDDEYCQKAWKTALSVQKGVQSL
tara:strand:- start:714 stop:1355 length:642 start_codon:yes stop_codon:yes gene_type:complete